MRTNEIQAATDASSGSRHAASLGVPAMAPRTRFTLGTKLFLLLLVVGLTGCFWALYEFAA